MIRSANNQDTNQIAEVHVRTWQVAYKNQIPNEILENLSIKSRLNIWENIINDTTQKTFVYVLNNKVIGFCNIGKYRESKNKKLEGEIRAIYLLSEYWSRGFGGKLLSESLEYFNANGFEVVYLWVLKTNDRVINFYKKFGFVADGKIKTDQREEYILNEIRMVKNIL